mgnify:CR=1 FL=1
MTENKELELESEITEEQEMEDIKIQGVFCSSPPSTALTRFPTRNLARLYAPLRIMLKPAFFRSLTMGALPPC